MPLQMKIQPLDAKAATDGKAATDAKAATARADPAKKSRLKRLLERQFPGVRRISSSEKLSSAADKDDGDLEPSSVCLDRMVLGFIEESNEKPPRCGRRRCNCFNGNCDDSSDDEFADLDAPATVSAAEILKGLVPCASMAERNLLADVARLAEKGKISKGKDGCRRIVTDGLRALGYDASICRSRWENTPSIPAGEYEYVDVITADGERLLVDVDFRSEFEIARSTKNYRTVLQSLPAVFVGKADRLQQIVAVVSEAARQSLKKRGLHFPPWRKPEYLRAKWLSVYHRTAAAAAVMGECEGVETSTPCPVTAARFSGAFVVPEAAAEEKGTVVVSPWRPPAVRPKASGKPVTAGLASALR